VAGALRRPGVALAALIALSTLVYWLEGRRHSGLWIMPDEAIYGTRAEQLWQHGRLSLFGGDGAGYSALYPLFAGGPLQTLGSLATGYAWLKPIQALTMSLTALPVFFFGRRLTGPWLALAAAALTLAMPLLLFSGFVMTEVLFYPLAAAALLAIARAVESAEIGDQLLALALVALAVLTRVQAVVLVPVFAAAVLVDALLAGSRPRWRRFWPLWSLLALGVVALAAAPELLGAYSTVASGGYPVGSALKYAWYHLVYVAVMTGVVPVAALVALLRREPDPQARALLSVTASAVPLVSVQVGVFASRYSPHLLGRDLAALPPLLFLCFALWLARGAPRPRFAASLSAVALLAAIVTVPWNDLVVNALPDAMGLALLLDRPLGLAPASAIAIGAVVLLIAFRFLPHRFMPPLVALVAVVLGGSTAVAANKVSDAANAAQPSFVGTPRDWIQRAIGTRPVTYVYDGDTAGWPIVWQQRFWNPGIARVVAITPQSVPGPIHETVIALPFDGRVPVTTRYVVANDALTLVGEAVAHQSRGPNAFGLTLWRLDGAPRLATVKSNFQPNGDIYGQASFTAFDCAGGDLQLTLLPKSTNRLRIYLDGKPVVDTHVAGEPVWHGTINVPADHPAGACNFLIQSEDLLGSTVVQFAGAA
jgi:hypothetical protein